MSMGSLGAGPLRHRSWTSESSAAAESHAPRSDDAFVGVPLAAPHATHLFSRIYTLRLPELWHASEESDLCCRICLACVGGLNLRPMKLHYTERGAGRYWVARPCRCGGCMGCPLEMSLMAGDGSNARLGMVVEDFSPYCGK